MSNELTRAQFASVEKSMQEAGYSVEKIKQEISFALQLINKSSQLQKCTPQSLQVAVLNISNIGLSLNPAAKEAYLIPRWNGVSKTMEASLEPGYVGLVKLLTDAGSVKSMTCQLVNENDFFEVDLANNQQPVKHIPELSRSKRGNIKGAYALATLVDGTRQVEYMSLEDIDEIKGRSETFKAYTDGKIKSCTWVSDFGEMARKTVIKRIYKYLPRTGRMDKIDEAIKHDNSDFGISESQLFYIDSLLHTSTLDQMQRDAIELETAVMTGQRAAQVIENLKANQQVSDKEAYKKLAVK